jgi:hypothetical protein
MKNLALLFCLAMGSAAPALASVVDITMTGSVTSGSDLFGAFGTGGSSLDGLGYSLVYHVDLDNGLREISPGIDKISGGSSIGQPAVVSADLTINGTTLLFAGGLIGAASLCDTDSLSCGVDLLVAGARQDGAVLSMISSVVFGFFLGTDVDLAAALSLGPLDILSVSSFFDYATTCDPLDPGCQQVSARGDLTIDSVKIESPAVALVPLPAGAGLLLAGLTTLGLLRRRRSPTAC